MLRSLDRALGGEEPPTSIQRWVARRPLLTGFAVAVAVGLFLSMFDTDLITLAFALLTGLIYGLTAFAERRRQERLKRRGVGLRRHGA